MFIFGRIYDAVDTASPPRFSQGSRRLKLARNKLIHIIHRIKWIMPANEGFPVFLASSRGVTASKNSKGLSHIWFTRLFAYFSLTLELVVHIIPKLPLKRVWERKANEAHVSTEHAPPLEGAWLPRSHGHQRRSRRYSSTQGQGPQAPVRLTPKGTIPFLCRR